MGEVVWMRFEMRCVIGVQNRRAAAESTVACPRRPGTLNAGTLSLVIGELVHSNCTVRTVLLIIVGLHPRVTFTRIYI